MKPKTLTIDGKEVAINGERNLLEVIRKAGIDLPTSATTATCRSTARAGCAWCRWRGAA
jgi:hypothetical protein